MLHSKQRVARLALRPLRCSWRGYADNKPPDPTTSTHSANSQPVTDSNAGPESSGTASGHAAGAGHHESTSHAHHPEPANESLGRGFYGTLAILTASLALFKFSRASSSDHSDAGNPEKQPFLTRQLQKFDSWQHEYQRRNIFHTKAIEQAGHDRNLFEGTRYNGHVDLKFPEIFNTGSPRNIVAGSAPNLDELRAHYQRERAEAEGKQVERLRKKSESTSILGHYGREGEEGQQKLGVVESVLEAFGFGR